jgi:hypothetical protein
VEHDQKGRKCAVELAEIWWIVGIIKDIFFFVSQSHNTHFWMKLRRKTRVTEILVYETVTGIHFGNSEYFDVCVAATVHWLVCWSVSIFNVAMTLFITKAWNASSRGTFHEWMFVIRLGL